MKLSGNGCGAQDLGRGLWGVLQVEFDSFDDLGCDDVWGRAWVESDACSGGVGNLDCAA